MDIGLDQRLAQVVAWRREQKARQEAAASSHDRDRRRNRERVLAELPRLMSRLTAVVAGLNDRLTDEGVIIVPGFAGHEAAAEAVYTLSLADDAESDPRLVLNVDWSGVAHAVLRGGASRSLLSASTVFDLDKDRITELVLTFLEARFA